MSLYAFHLEQIISTDLGQVDHGVQDGNAFRTRSRDKTPETDHTQKRLFCHDAICKSVSSFLFSEIPVSVDILVIEAKF